MPLDSAIMKSYGAVKLFKEELSSLKGDNSFWMVLANEGVVILFAL